MLLVHILVVLGLGYCVNIRGECFKFLAPCTYIGTHVYDAIHIYLFLDACVSVFSEFAYVRISRIGLSSRVRKSLQK